MGCLLSVHFKEQFEVLRIEQERDTSNISISRQKMQGIPPGLILIKDSVTFV